MPRRNASLLLALLSLVILSSASALAQTFSERPITDGLYEFTAYPLNGGGVRIGDLFLPFDSSQLRFIAVDLGITNNFQIGTTIPVDFLGTPNLFGKYRFLHLASGMDFAWPFSVSLTLEPRELVLAGGLILSSVLSKGLGFHSGFWISFSSQSGFGLSTLYAIVDVDILPDAKLLFELDFYPAAIDRVQLSVGELQRFGLLNFKVIATVALPSAVNVLTANFFLRF